MIKTKIYRQIAALSLVTIMACVLVALVIFNLNSKKTLQKIIVEASQITDKDEVMVDFSKQIGTGSPLVFGGAHAPNIEDQDAWNLISDVGVTMIRRDFFIENELPLNITLEDYKNNVNGVQDPSKWNWDNINATNELYLNAKKRGMKIMGILAYSPGWLTYSGTSKGVPKDWNVYKDIVKKLYRIHRNNLDLIEIWNEPDLIQFLDIKNSGLTRTEAYLKIFTAASQAIREVDDEMNDGKKIPIIAPAVSDPNDTTLLEYVLKSDASNYLEGISIHSYDKIEPSWAKYLEIMKKYGKGNLPIYVSEWNKTSEYVKDNPYTSSDLAITYTGGKLIDFLKYEAAGANYFSTTYFDSSSQDKYINSFGFYTKTGSKVSLLPQGKAWRVLSRDLELGTGTSKIVYSNQGNNLKTLGAISKGGKLVLALVNDENSSKLISIAAKNLSMSGNNVHIDIYTASPKEDGRFPTCSEDVDIVNNSVSFKTIVSGNSVNGITILQPILSLNLLLKVLGVSTSQGCIFK